MYIYDVYLKHLKSLVYFEIKEKEYLSEKSELENTFVTGLSSTVCKISSLVYSAGF